MELIKSMKLRVVMEQSGLISFSRTGVTAFKESPTEKGYIVARQKLRHKVSMHARKVSFQNASCQIVFCFFSYIAALANRLCVRA